MCARPTGRGGGPGTPAEYAAAAAGYPALACSDYGSVAAWPAWERACQARGLRPIYGLGFDLALDVGEAAPWPLLALAATGAGLRHLVQLHNQVARAADGHCTLLLADLSPLAAGLWLILLPTGDAAPAPLAALPRRAALAAMARMHASLPQPAALLSGLPPGPEQDYFADLAAAAALPSVALPSVRYPTPAQAPLHALTRYQGSSIRSPESAGINTEHCLEAPVRVAARFAAHPDALALAARVADSCRATLADLATPGAWGDAADDLDAAVDEALAAQGRAREPVLDAEIAALRGTAQAGSLLTARRVAAVGRELGLVLGAPGGLAAEGQVPALLGLCPPDPTGAPPRWLVNPAAPAWTPLVRVAAGWRADLLARLGGSHGGATAGGTCPALVQAGEAGPRGPAAALALAAAAFDLAPAQRAALDGALLSGRPADRADHWRAAAADLAPDAAATLYDWVAILETTPGPVLADGEALLVVPPGLALPLQAPVGGGPEVAAWSAAACEALGAGVLLLRGDPGLDVVQRALDLVSGPPPRLPVDDLRLLLTGGEIAGLPLPALDEDVANNPEFNTHNVTLAALAALLPDDPDDGPGWAAVGALFYGPRGPHAWLQTYLRRWLASAAVPYPYPALAPVLDCTWGLPLFQEQLALLGLLLRPDGPIAPRDRMALEEWAGQAAGWALPYTAAHAAGQQLHLALRLKAAHPAAFLAAALEGALVRDDPAAVDALVLEAGRRGIALLPPDVQVSAAGFTVEAAPVAIRWGLAWSRDTGPAAAALVAARARQPEGRFASLAALGEAAVAADLAPAYLAALIRAGAGDSLGARPALLAALPRTLATARPARRPLHAGGGQAMMFADEESGIRSQESRMVGLPDGDPIPTAASVSVGEGADSDQENLMQNSELKIQNSIQYAAWERALLGHAFTPPPGAEPILRTAARPTGPAIARLTLGGITAGHVGQTISLAVVLGGLRVVPPGPGADPAEEMAVALAADGEGALPLVIFPPVYARVRALVAPDTPVIVAARVQVAEAGAAGGAGLVLVAEGVQPYQVPRKAQEIDVTPLKRRGSALPPAEAAPRPAKKAAPDPRQYSASGQPYFRAAPGAGPGGTTAPPGPTPGQVVITLHPTATDVEDVERMRQLKAILVRHPGATAVLLYFPDDPTVGGPTWMPIKRPVDPSAALRAEVEALLGAGSFALRE